MKTLLYISLLFFTSLSLANPGAKDYALKAQQDFYQKFSKTCPKTHYLELKSIDGKKSVYNCVHKKTKKLSANYRWETHKNKGEERVHLIKTPNKKIDIRYNKKGKPVQIKSKNKTCSFKYNKDGSLAPDSTTSACMRVRSGIEHYINEQNKKMASPGCDGGVLSSDGTRITCPNGKVYKQDSSVSDMYRKIQKAYHDKINGASPQKDASTTDK